MAASSLRTEPALLAEAYRQDQSRRAAAMAAIAVYYWRTRTDPQDPSAVQRWLDFIIPKILGERDRSAALGRALGDRIRALELPGVADGYKYPTLPGLDPAALRTSLSVTGPVAVQKKVHTWNALTSAEIEKLLEVKPSETARIDSNMLEAKAKAEAEVTIAGAVVRHVQNGGRETLVEGAVKDKVSLGWVRVTRGNPCYFCAMLASRGRVYEGQSFDASDPRFVGGAGTAKVHDNCNCSIKPVYSHSDELVQRTDAYEQMWRDWGVGATAADKIKNFRQAYEGRA